MDNKLVLDDQLPQLSSKIEFNIDKNNNTEKYENNINNFKINKDDININAKFEQFLKEEDIIPEPIENMDFNKQNCFSERNLKKYPTVNSIIKHEKTINSYEVKIPKNKIRDRIIELETELFSLMNIEYGKEIIYEDFVLVSNNENYYVHLLRTENLDPNKENFLLIHGFLSSSTHFLSVLPFLLQKYNVFIPDTLGMGLSSRPQVEFIF